MNRQADNSNRNAIRVLIIDDERPARELVGALLAEHEDVVVVGECSNGKQALADIEKHKPDLIFLDIRMPQLDGFGVLEQLDKEAPPVVIFVTAYDQYAVRAFEVRALDYLLKPIRRQRFTEAMQRARELLARPQPAVTENLRGLLQHWDRRNDKATPLAQSEYLQRIFVRNRRKSVTIEAEEIDWIGSLDHFVEIHSKGKSFVLHEKLSALEQKLDPAHFLRIHRTRIVNLKAIRRFSVEPSGNYHAHLHDGTSHRVARARCQQLRELLAGNR